MSYYSTTSIEELNNYLDLIIGKVLEIKEQINQGFETQIQQINKQKQELEILSQRIKKVSPSIKEIVKFNVGGKKFATSKQKLLLEESFFSSILSTHFSVEKDEKGAIFIDRNPKYFQIILDYFRNQQLSVSELSLHDKKGLLQDAEFYQVKSLIDLLTPKEDVINTLQFVSGHPSGRISLSNNNTAITVSPQASLNYDCAILCTKSVKRWRVSISNLSTSPYLMFGLADPLHFILSGSNYDREGSVVYMLCTNGNILKPNAAIGQMTENLRTAVFKYHKYVNYTSEFTNSNSTIDCFYENNSLRFIINNVDKGIAFSNLPDNLVPAFDFGAGCTISIQEL